ncbi:FadR/GntR family transcriptional regulator [Microbacterium amylolyticum]|uniref:DNA-binding FadR family transcriptional regulator n=1 Tax=Microbacterium amylolyticum TaxID=936337 RepID=A0ABS4ZK35_9MICO|nr:FadR/GntR family transcriptional regulator [Microbacterium amylolyticum]MBP2437654.1 DNA-binding FadR family transcriptional regulator [Microbacterium amylolyticum]
MSRSIHDGVVDDLGERIASGALPPGSILTLARIEDECAASRTVAREAIRVLESIGMVMSRRRVGITVRPREEWDAFSPQLIEWNLRGPFRQQQLEALMELRVAVEPMAARLTAQRASPGQRAELRRLAQALHELGAKGHGASDEFLEVDVAFHLLLLRASGNPQLAALTRPVEEVLRGRSRLGLTPSVPAPGTLEEHAAVADAVTSGDSALAEHHSRTHMHTVWDEIQNDGSLSV